MKPDVWLARLAEGVRDSTKRLLDDPSIEYIPRLKASKSATFGWYVCFARFRPPRVGRLEVWVDEWTGSDRLRLCVCVSVRSRAQLEKLIESGAGGRRPGRLLRQRDVSRADPQGRSRLKAPLREGDFEVPIAEAYADYCHYSVFFDEHLDFDRPAPVRLRKVLSATAAALAGAARGTGSSDPLTEVDYSDIENRALVRRHVARERSRRLADLAKTRDGFTCRICGVNFGALYGDIGTGFAEAHHIVPLASTKALRRTVVDDLITVCANCHRMLHRLHGRSDDPERLQTLLTHRWPSRRRRS